MRRFIMFSSVLMSVLLSIMPTQASTKSLITTENTCSYQAVYKLSDKRQAEYAERIQCGRIKKIKVVYA